MNLGREKSLSRHDILEKISEYDIYRYYLGYDFKLKKSYHSPFRSNDRNPSFGIFVGNSGDLLYKDFGINATGDCVKFVSQLFGLSYGQALHKIDRDFGLGCWSAVKRPELGIKAYKRPMIAQESRPTEIQVITKPFTRDEQSYWAAYGISTEDLAQEKVFSVRRLFVNKKEIKGKDLCFAYYYKDEQGGQYLKIYTPFSKQHKWISNVPIKTAFNLHKLPKESPTILIAKSKKCKIVLQKLVTDVYEVQKEGWEVITPYLDDYFNQHYTRKVCFFDNDNAGITANKALNPLGYDWINIPGYYQRDEIKDPSDLVKRHGYEVLRALLTKKGLL